MNRRTVGRDQPDLWDRLISGAVEHERAIEHEKAIAAGYRQGSED